MPSSPLNHLSARVGCHGASLAPDGAARETGQAFWLMGRYADAYLRIAGEWKISALKMAILSFTPCKAAPSKRLIAPLAAA